MSSPALSHDVIDAADFTTQAEIIDRLGAKAPLVALTPARYRSFFQEYEPKVLAVSRNGKLVDVGALILRRQRFDKTLVVTISSLLSEPDYFWSSMTVLARDWRVNRVMIEMFGAPADDQRAFEGEKLRQRTQIYVCDLTRDDLAAELSSNHRRNIRKAEAQGFDVVEESSPKAIEDHVRLCGASNDRRSGRGEQIQGNKDRAATEAYLKTGQATLYQAVHEGTAYSSILVLRIGAAAYYDTGGTSPEGMKMGGSHFLMFKVMERLKAEGVTSFSLDVANTEGLIKFKTGFGAVEWPLQRVYLEYPNIISRLRRLLRL